ncbi:MAG: pyridoxal phosphate-dependent aminotransferase [Oscillospiraceae bacterium]|nr:pyridoxal phosphate-dependent aminotransferase [Oscillospiraceae bacterium]
MKELSASAQAVRASTTIAIDSLYKKMKAEGYDVIGFGAGEPDFNTPDHIKEAGINAIRSNQTRYTPAAGTERLRAAVCKRLEQDCGLFYEPSQIVAASGAKHNVFAALMALLNPGDEVILPAPYWVSYYEMIRMAGGVPVVVNAPEAEEFKLSPAAMEAAVTSKTKAIILNNPSNPTGMLYDRAALTAIGEICLKHDLYVIADEIYYSLIYDGNSFVSFPSLSPELKEHTILINGVSKTYAMTGWRVGYAAANPRIARVMANYLSHSTSAPSTISQAAAAAALEGPQDSIEEMRRQFEARRDYMMERISKIRGVSCIKPQGAFYAMMNIEPLLGRVISGTLMEDADSFASAFLEKGLVAVVPCTGFGAPHHIRWSYATSMENIKEGMDRLERFLLG